MKPIGRALIEKYIDGRCTPEEEDCIHLWIDSNDSDNYPPFLSEAKYRRKEQNNWKRLVLELQGKEMPSLHRQFPFGFLLRCAAALFLLLSGIWAINSYTNGMFWWTGEQYTTSYGETKQINLPDGSVVMLNAMSELKIAEDYGQIKRELYLTGECYFKVQKDKNKPFIVHSKGVATEALGTQFNVSAYPGDKKVIVSLQEGKVKVTKAEPEKKDREVVFLTRGQEVVYQTDHRAAKKTFVEKERLGWKEHTLYFKDDNIEDVMGKLTRFYGVDFDYSSINDSDWKLNGEYKNQSLNDVLESLSFNYNFRYEIVDKKVILSR